MSVMFQLGQLTGQLLGIYLQSLVPDVPQFDDSDNTAEVEVQRHAGAGHGR